MIKYYFLLFFRNIRRQKLFSGINLLGLTAGIVSTLLIYLYVQHEMSYDRFHEKADRICRINQTFIWGENNDHQFASTGPGVAYALLAEIPEIKEATRIHPPGNALISYTDGKNDVRTFDEGGVLAVDSNFFKMFTFRLVKGDRLSALQAPNSIVLTESAAKKYFGAEEPIGKLLQVGNIVVDENFSNTTLNPPTAFQVTAVVKDPPGNSYIDFDMLISMSSLPKVKKESWIWTAFETYVLLDEHASMEAVRQKLPGLPKKYAEATLQRNMNLSFDEYTKSGKKWELFIQPLTDIRLHSSNIYNRINNVGDITTLYVLMGVEVFIILLSCINFMNLSTAQYTRRIKESSLRKILGSNRYQLAFHFFSEAFMFCFLAMIIGLGITQLILPYFNILTNNDLKLNLFGNPQIMWVLGGLTLLMSVLSGSYPAIFLSTFPPVEAIKGKIRGGKHGKTLRNGLVTLQFSVSMILIACTAVVFQQLTYLSGKDIGFNRENLLVVNRLEWVNDKETFLHAIENIPGVEKASWCTSVPPRLYDGDQFKVEDNRDKTTPLNYVKADEHYVPTLGLEMKVGRNFSNDVPADLERVILNETAVKELGWALDERVIGKKVEYPGMQKTFEVVGVVRDFNFWSLQAPIEPMAIFHVRGSIFSSGQEFTALRITPGNLETWNTLIASLQKQWKEYAGDKPFQYEFVDQAFAETFKAEAQFGKALTIFAILAVMIASFGLLGMIIYTLEQRTKEIGIRKVVGASVWNIWVLVVKDYTILIVCAIVLSTPICFWFLNQWLQGFEYRVRISPWVFVLSGACMLITSLLITGYHVVKAALKNPVMVLKDE